MTSRTDAVIFFLVLCGVIFGLGVDANTSTQHSTDINTRIRKRSAEQTHHHTAWGRVSLDERYAVNISCESSQRSVYILDTFWGIHANQNVTSERYSSGDCTSHDPDVTSHCTGQNFCEVNNSVPVKLSCNSAWTGQGATQYLQIDYYCKSGAIHTLDMCTEPAHSIVTNEAYITSPGYHNMTTAMDDCFCRISTINGQATVATLKQIDFKLSHNTDTCPLVIQLKDEKHCKNYDLLTSSMAPPAYNLTIDQSIDALVGVSIKKSLHGNFWFLLESADQVNVTCGREYVTDKTSGSPATQQTTNLLSVTGTPTAQHATDMTSVSSSPSGSPTTQQTMDISSVSSSPSDVPPSDAQTTQQITEIPSVSSSPSVTPTTQQATDVYSVSSSPSKAPTTNGSTFNTTQASTRSVDTSTATNVSGKNNMSEVTNVSPSTASVSKATGISTNLSTIHTETTTTDLSTTNSIKTTSQSTVITTISSTKSDQKTGTPVLLTTSMVDKTTVHNINSEPTTSTGISQTAYVVSKTDTTQFTPSTIALESTTALSSTDPVKMNNATAIIGGTTEKTSLSSNTVISSAATRMKIDNSTTHAMVSGTTTTRDTTMPALKTIEATNDAGTSTVSTGISEASTNAQTSIATSSTSMTIIWWDVSTTHFTNATVAEYVVDKRGLVISAIVGSFAFLAISAMVVATVCYICRRKNNGNPEDPHSDVIKPLPRIPRAETVFSKDSKSHINGSQPKHLHKNSFYGGDISNGYPIRKSESLTYGWSESNQSKHNTVTDWLKMHDAPRYMNQSNPASDKTTWYDEINDTKSRVSNEYVILDRHDKYKNMRTASGYQTKPPTTVSNGQKKQTYSGDSDHSVYSVSVTITRNRDSDDSGIQGDSYNQDKINENKFKPLTEGHQKRLAYSFSKLK